MEIQTAGRWGMALWTLLLAGCSARQNPDPDVSRLAAFVRTAEIVGFRNDAHEVILTPCPPELVAILDGFRAGERTDHLPLLVEYGLRLHLCDLQNSGLARYLPDDPMIRELIRLCGLQELRTAADGGWLESQFYRFTPGGRSTFQIYELARSRFAHVPRILQLLRMIESTGRSGIGGDGRCHYGCA